MRGNAFLIAHTSKFVYGFYLCILKSTNHMFMKKSLLTLICILSFSLISAQSISDSVATLYLNYLKIEKDKLALEDSLKKVNEDFKAVSTQVNDFGSDLSSSLQQVNRLTENDLLSKESRLKTKKDKIVTTARFIRAATNSFDAIDAALAQSDYLNDVGQLNSPTNEDLGFSLNKKIIALIDEQIIKENSKFNDKNPGKFRQIVTTIIENPITTALTSSVPALSSISAVVDIVAASVVREKDVTVDDLKKFKNSLGKYINHYEGLARASYDFNSNLDKLKVKTGALRSVLNDFTISRINTLHPGAVPPDQASYNLNDLTSTYYRPEELNLQLDVIINTYKTRGRIDYQSALNEPRFSYPLYAVNQAQFIQQELESITNEYISNYRLYHDRLRQILENSKTISDDITKVDKKQDELDQKLERLITTFRKNVKIKEVNRALQRIPTY